MAAKYNNPYRFPDALLVEVQYIYRDKVARILIGEVTGKGWGRWKYGEKGLLHIADAIMLVKRGYVRPVDTQDYSAKEAALNKGSTVSAKDIAPDKPKPRSMNVANILFVGPTTAQRFSEAGVNTVQEVAELTPERIVEIVHLPHMNKSRAEAIIKDAKAIIESNAL